LSLSAGSRLSFAAAAAVPPRGQYLTRPPFRRSAAPKGRQAAPAGEQEQER